MKYLFDFGLSQEDSDTEIQSLDIRRGDNLLCVASAGEIPLNIMARKNINIVAVDLSLNQIYLSKLKLIASRLFEPLEAAGFLGFNKMEKQYRSKLFNKSLELMTADEKYFWHSRTKEIENGIINEGRFEKYILKFGSIALALIGKKKLLKLMEFDSIIDQRDFFDDHFNTKLLKKLFDCAFNMKIYKDRAVAGQGLQNSNNISKSEFFYYRFRSFCTSTPARENYFLQYFLLHEVLFKEALPDYLTEQGMKNIRNNFECLSFVPLSYLQAVEQSDKLKFNKFHLSNIGDWMSRKQFEVLLYRINESAMRPFRAFIRYLYQFYSLPDSLKSEISVENDLEVMLIQKDRFPFYRLVTLRSL